MPPRPLVLGHRGGRGEGFPRENSLEAFALARAQGADGVELDARLAASGEVVLHHDPRYDDGRPVVDVEWRDRPAGLATLGDALEVCKGQLVNVEIKADAPGRVRLVRAVARVLASRAGAACDIVVSSFDPFVVAAAAAAAPRFRRGMLVGDRTPRLAVALPLAVRRIVCAAHLADAIVTADRVDRLRARGLSVVAWTVNDPVRARALARMGVSTIITDRPAEILAALGLPGDSRQG